MTGRWLIPWNPRPDARPVLLCLPPAGAGCGQFGSWQAALGDCVSVIGVQLPGRENRWAEPPPATVGGAVDAVAAELTGLVPADVPVVVFGHSFGGLLGYEIAKRLGNGYRRWPRALVVAACRPPHLWVGAGRGLVDDDRELARLLDDRRLGADDLDEDSRELMLEVLRLDARLSLSYAGDARTPVGCHLEAWGGRRDRTVLAEHVTGWREYAGERFQDRLFPGGHYFCLESAASSLAVLSELLPGGKGPLCSST